MAASLGRYRITSPATSELFRAAMRRAIDDGSRRIDLVLVDIDTQKTLEIEFTLERTVYREMSAEYLGRLADNGVATISATTHTDLNDTPAHLTLVRRVTP